MEDLVTVVDRHATRRPDQPAVITATQSVTYSELLRRASSEASVHGRSRRAVTGEDAVTVAVAVLASAMAQGGALMVDPSAPAAEADRARARFGCGTDRDDLPSGLGLTTSGVTGEPRCAVRPWELVADNATAFAEALRLTPDDVVMTTSSMHHSYAVSAGLCTALTAGASFAAPGGLLKPSALARCIDSYSVSVLLSVPMLYRWYTAGIPAARVPRLCVSAGERLDDEVRKEWATTVGWPLAEHFGTSELGQLTLAAPSDAGFGMPVRGVTIRTAGQAVEVSVAGPPTVMLDLADGQISARVLAGWQATGDIGTVDGSGRVRIDGRQGDIVNVAGKKVALPEVDVALRALPGVRDGAAIAHAGPGGVPKLYAFVVVEADFRSSDAVTLLRENLAPHKVPRYIQRVDRLPRTGSGKLRRYELERLILEPAPSPQASAVRAVTVTFDGPGAGVSALTWGGQAIRRSIDWLGEDASYFNDRNILDMPDGTTLDQIASAVGTIVSRHQALRTYYASVDGEVVMRVQRTGKLRLSVHEPPNGSEPREWAMRLADELAVGLFSEQELPLRCAVVEVAGAPRFLLLVLSHQSIDAWAVDIIKSDLRQLWARSAEALDPRPWQLLDQSADERSGLLQRGAASLDYWRTLYATAAPTMFDAQRQVPQPYHVQSVIMTSPCLLVAVEAIARRLRTSTAAVLAGLVAVVLGLLTEHDRITLLLIAGNRFDAKRRQVVAPLVQDVLCQILLGTDTDAVVRDAAASTLTAYSHAFYDPTAELTIRREAELRRGVCFDFHGVIINDVRPRGQWRASRADAAVDLDELRGLTAFERGGRWRRQNTTCFVRVLPEPEVCRMEVMADTRYLSVADMRDMLAAIEALAVAAVDSAVQIEQTAAICAVPRLRRDANWVKHRNGWVDVPRLTSLLRGLPMCQAAAVLAEEGTLTAYVSLTGGPDITSLHRAVIAALRADRGVAVAPDRYVVCAAPPTDPDAPRAWTACAVVAAADGRPG
jgi:acyl-CoA synthetase (AMP-forming)/AMP-acid ligase II